MTQVDTEGAVVAGSRTGALGGLADVPAPLGDQQ